MFNTESKTSSSHCIDITIENFESHVINASDSTPVLIDFWAEWCGPCKTLGPILEKIAEEYNGAFILAKVDVESQQELAGAFNIRSIPTVFLFKNRQPVDGFQSALTESQVRQFLQHHGIEPFPQAPIPELEDDVIDPHAEVIRLRKAIEADPNTPELSLDLALALTKVGVTQEALSLLDALPANLATDDRTLRARARLAFMALTENAPAVEVLQVAIEHNADDMQARHLLGAYYLVHHQEEAALEQFLEMLKRQRQYADGLPQKCLIDAFRVIEDVDLVGTYRRKMSSLLF